MKKIIFLILLICLSTISYSNEITKDKQMLLFYVTLDDSVMLFRKDSAWLNKDNCFELHIDTIETNEILKFKNNPPYFFYRGIIFSDKQLFELSEYKNLLEYKIKFIDFSPIASVIIDGTNTESQCIHKNKYSGNFLSSYWMCYKNHINNDNLNWKRDKELYGLYDDWLINLNCSVCNNKNECIVLNDVIWILRYRSFIK